ncbi:MAG: hypothetical protein AAGI44_09100 [Pseudomonadota bacterium]
MQSSQLSAANGHCTRVASPMKKILLHVGTHKTGSTSIQQTLFKNREVLQENDIHYLNFGSNHWHLYSAFMAKPWDWFEHKRMGRDKASVEELNERTLRDVTQEISSSGCNNIVISSEYLAQLPRKGIARMRDYLAELGEVTVVYYCRELISWISSDSQQCAKVGMKDKPTTYEVAIKRLYDFPLNYIDIFGLENFRLVRFEDAIKQGLCNSLLLQGNLPRIEQLGLAESAVNASISAEAVNAFFVLNRIHPLFGDTRSESIAQTLKGMPGRSYRVNQLTREQVNDCNKKMRYMRSKFKFPMYDKLRLEFESGGDEFYSDEAIAYLLNAFNAKNVNHEKLVSETRALKKQAKAAIHQVRESRANGESVNAEEVFLNVLESMARFPLRDFSS